jgi:phosphoglycolate phosphatase
MPGPYLLRNAIFDLDGTLVDSRGDIQDCLVQACVRHGIGGAEGRIIGKIAIGPPLAEMLRALIPELAEHQFSPIIAAFRALYDVSLLTKTVAYPGVYDVLRQFRIDGGTLMLATNKPRLPTRRILDKLGVSTWFADVVTPDDFPTGAATKARMVRRLIETWNLMKDRTIVIGDAPADIEAARENGVLSAAVLCGYGNAEELKSCGPTATLETIGELYGCGQFYFR